MQRARFSTWWVSLGLVLGLSAGCSSDSGGTKKDAGVDGGGTTDDGGGGTGGNTGIDAGKPDSGTNTSKPDTGVDAGPCVPKGCSELGYQCGTPDDGCGTMLDCDPNGTACTGFETCGGDPAKPYNCGCKPKTCADVIVGGAQCGKAVPDGCGGTIADCGDCPTNTKANNVCGASSLQCECTPTSKAVACGARACGEVPDGCGATYKCGENSGACADSSLSCDVAGACVCPQGQSCCSPSTKEALCANVECGEVTDPCNGAKYTCGCADGSKGCVDKAYIEGATASKCVDGTLASVLGGYVVRVHAFTNAAGGVQRAESVSLVKILQKQDSSLQLIDNGCVATTNNSMGGLQSAAKSYYNIPPVVTKPTLSGTTLTRSFQEPGVGLGFIPGLPPYCDGANATPSTENRGDFDTIAGDGSAAPTPGSGAIKPWITANGGLCTCPTKMASTSEQGYCDPSTFAQTSDGKPTATANNCLPPANTKDGMVAQSTDCRLNDIDGDGKPGFTVTSTGLNSNAVTFANIKWTVQVDPSGDHAGTAVDPKPLYRQWVGCSGGLCGFLSGVTNTSCGEQRNRIQFHKLPSAEFESLTCQAFYNSGDGSIKQSAINGYFTGQMSCGAGDTCPEGLICRSGTCYPETSVGACENGVSCGTGFKCNTNANTLVNNSCWPSSCP